MFRLAARAALARCDVGFYNDKCCRLATCVVRPWLLQGDADSARAMYGGRVVVHSPPSLPRAQLRLDNVELTRMGQAFRMGRYSVHFYFHLDASASWVRGCAIHRTYNGAVGLHGTQRMLLQNNVAYNTMGHAFLMEVRIACRCATAASSVGEPASTCAAQHLPYARTRTRGGNS